VVILHQPALSAH